VDARFDPGVCDERGHAEHDRRNEEAVLRGPEDLGDGHPAGKGHGRMT